MIIKRIVLWVSFSLIVLFGVSGMKFPSVQKISFEKTNCSPAIPKGFTSGVLFNLPSEIIWGEEIPLCGFFKDNVDNYPGDQTNSTFGLIVESIRSNENELRLKDVYEVRDVGDPEIKMSGTVFQNFKKNGELYFNVNVQHKYRPMPPGDYKMTLNFRDYNSEPKVLKIIAEGWRLKFSNLMIEEICKGEILKDLSNYLSINFKLEVIDLSPDGEKRIYKELEQAWVAGYSKHKQKFESVLPKEGYILDDSISFYIKNQVQKKCPKTELKSSAVTYILRGISKSK